MIAGLAMRLFESGKEFTLFLCGASSLLSDSGEKGRGRLFHTYSVLNRDAREGIFRYDDVIDEIDAEDSSGSD